MNYKKYPLEGDVSLESKTGEILYSLASREDVKNFLELGTQWGNSAYVIGLGLKEKGFGECHTVEFIEKRYKKSKSTLQDLEVPVVCHHGMSFDSQGCRVHYSSNSNNFGNFKVNILESLCSKIDFDAAFLDTTSSTQDAEFEFLSEKTNVRYIVLHDADVKSPKLLRKCLKDRGGLSTGWKVLDSCRDSIKGSPLILFLERV